MNVLTQGVTVDRRAWLLRFVALIAAALMLSLTAFSTSAQAAAPAGLRGCGQGKIEA